MSEGLRLLLFLFFILKCTLKLPSSSFSQVLIDLLQLVSSLWWNWALGLGVLQSTATSAALLPWPSRGTPGAWQRGHNAENNFPMADAAGPSEGTVFTGRKQEETQ